MKKSFVLYLLLFATLLVASEKPAEVEAIIKDARSTAGSEADLNSLVTLKMSGIIKPVKLDQPTARFLLIARKPCSQRLEVHIENMVETTLLQGDSGCFIRSNPSDADKHSQFRKMTAEEICRMTFNTRQLFNFYREDSGNGESVDYRGIEQWRGADCYKLVYSSSDGISATRYFSVARKELVSTITDKGVENVEVGRQVVNGIQFPKQIEYYEAGNLLHTLVLETIEVNKPLQAGIFNIPFAWETK